MLKPDTKLKIAASCFSIYAFEALKKELSKIDSLEFIFTSPTFVPKAPMQQYASVQNKDTDTVYMPLHGFTAVDLGYQQGDASVANDSIKINIEQIFKLISPHTEIKTL